MNIEKTYEVKTLSSETRDC